MHRAQWSGGGGGEAKRVGDDEDTPTAIHVYSRPGNDHGQPSKKCLHGGQELKTEKRRNIVNSF